MFAFPQEILIRARAVELAIFDVDGVLTDGRLHYSEQGEAIKVFHVHDGHGLVRLRQAGVRIAVISGRGGRATLRRLQELKFDFITTDCRDKAVALDELLRQTKLSAHQCAMMGDDEPDVPVLMRCGLALAPPQAMPCVLTQAHWVTKASAGMGAVREACELILMARQAND